MIKLFWKKFFLKVLDSNNAHRLVRDILAEIVEGLCKKFKTILIPCFNCPILIINQDLSLIENKL
jgi:hypothetical protein